MTNTLCEAIRHDLTPPASCKRPGRWLERNPARRALGAVQGAGNADHSGPRAAVRCHPQPP